MEHSVRRTTFKESSPRVQRSGPPAAAWLTAVMGVALSAAFVVATAMFRGIDVESSATRLLVVVGVSAGLLLGMFIAVLLMPWISPRVRFWSQIILGICLGFAGGMHFILTREHLEESTLLGLGFVAAGVLQLVLAIAVLRAALRRRQSQPVYFAVAAVNAGLVFLYVIHVWLGLPLAGNVTATTLGSREEVDLAGLATKLAELVSLVLAFVALSSFRAVPSQRRAEPHQTSNWARTSA